MLEDSFDVDRIDELLKLVGDEQDTEEMDADVENLADRVNSDKARLVLLSLFDFVDCELDDNEAFDLDILFFLLLVIDSFRLRRKSDSELCFKTPIVRADLNLERPEIEPFLSVLLFRFLFDIGGRRRRRKDRITLLLCLATVLFCALSSVASASASALKLSLKLTFFGLGFSIEFTILSISYRFSMGEVWPLISIIFSTLFSTVFRLDTVFR